MSIHQYVYYVESDFISLLHRKRCINIERGMADV